jgi:hypothetical protein
VPHQNGPSSPKKKAPLMKGKPLMDAKLLKKLKPLTDTELIKKGLKNPKRYSLNNWVKFNSVAKNSPIMVDI